MNNSFQPIKDKLALRHLMDFLRVEGLSGQEQAVSRLVERRIVKAGIPATCLSRDRAHEKIGRGFVTGNLIVRLPGNPRMGKRRLFMGHMDTVPLCRSAEPVRRKHRIVSKGKTALGADNRTAVACLVTVIEAIARNDLPHPPLTFLFTVGEEIGLLGARYVRKRDLGNPAMGFNIDSGAPADFVTGAIGADRWEAGVFGRSSHAGMHPEHGISATLIASRALAEVEEKGYFGKIVKGRRQGTSNVGRFEGGEASNQVTEFVKVTGESRSHHEPFIDRITQVYRTAFERAARSTKNHLGRTGRVRFRSERDYHPFRMPDSSPPVRFACRIADELDLHPTTQTVNGGLDANYLNAKGIPTLTLGAGQHGAHTVDEYADIREYLDGCRLALALATSEAT